MGHIVEQQVFFYLYMSEMKGGDQSAPPSATVTSQHVKKKILYSPHSYNLLILRMSMSDMSSRCPIGTDGSGMGVMVSSPCVDEKAVLDLNKGGEMKLQVSR